MRFFKAKETSRLKRVGDATIYVQLVDNPKARFASTISVKYNKPYIGLHRRICWYYVTERYYSNSKNIGYLMRRGTIILKRLKGIRDDKTYKIL